MLEGNGNREWRDHMQRRERMVEARRELDASIVVIEEIEARLRASGRWPDGRADTPPPTPTP